MKKEKLFENFAMALIIAVTIMATASSIFVVRTGLDYWICRDNYTVSAETAAKTGWTDSLHEDAKSAQADLEELAENNFLAGIIYSCENAVLKFFLLLILIFLVLAVMVWDCFVGLLIYRTATHQLD